MPWGRRSARSLDDPSADKRLLDVLVQHGADLSKARSTRAYVYFSSEADARAAADQLAADRVTVEVTQQKKRSWLALLTTEMVVDEDSIRHLGDILRAVAADHGGTYTGWEASPSP